MTLPPALRRFPVLSLLAAGLVLAMPGAGRADGFYVRDLGEGGAPEACMAQALAALTAYAADTGTPGAVIQAGIWSVDAYDLQPGAVDVDISCPYRDGYVGVVLMTAHSAGSEAERAAVIDGINGHWDSDPRPQDGGATK
ncbi:hypothetical protein [Pararhodobacter aggregans]|uniref:hypothetical protein n=1 Tax=Pararhodobacter aggregans TaxID=404875 RepID=UPI003A8E4599